MPNEVVATLKGDGSATWIVFHAEDVAEAERLIEEALKGSFFQTTAEASTLLGGAVKVANGMAVPQTAPAPAPAGIDWQKVGQAAQQDQYQRQQVQPAPGGWQQPAQASSFNGTPHPQGMLCQMCNSAVTGKQPKPGGKRLWCCPNQRTKGDGHFVQWIND